MSDFKIWNQKPHAKDWLIFPENIGKRLSIDETSLSNGELYTILTNKSGKGRKGTIVAMVAGTKAETVIAIIEKIPLKQRNLVAEITLDMAGNMGLIAKKCFPNATRVTDRFTHVLHLNFGNRDTTSLNSRSKTSHRSFTRNQNQIPLASHRSKKRGYRKSQEKQEKVRTRSFEQWRYS